MRFIRSRDAGERRLSHQCAGRSMSSGCAVSLSCTQLLLLAGNSWELTVPGTNTPEGLGLTSSITTETREFATLSIERQAEPVATLPTAECEEWEQDAYSYPEWESGTTLDSWCLGSVGASSLSLEWASDLVSSAASEQRIHVKFNVKNENNAEEIKVGKKQKQPYYTQQSKNIFVGLTSQCGVTPSRLRANLRHRWTKVTGGGAGRFCGFEANTPSGQKDAIVGTDNCFRLWM